MGFILQFLVFTSLLILALIGGITEKMKETVRGSTFFILLIVGVNFVFYRKIDFSLGMGFRFLVLMCSATIFFVTTAPEELGEVLTYLRFPYSISFALVTATRFIPTLALEAQDIIDAQRSRGLELERGNFVQRVKNYIPILIPLIFNAVKRSLELAEALESRCFGVEKKRTSLTKLKFSAEDYIVSFLLVSATISVFSLQFYLNIENCFLLGF